MPPRLMARPVPLPYAVLSTTRCFISTSLAPPPPLSGFARLTSRRLILLTGRDAPRFLQGLTTRNIPPATSQSDQDPTKGLYSAFLNASGRVLHDVFIYPGVPHRVTARESPSFVIEVDSEEVHTLAKHLKRYKLRANIRVDILEDYELAAWSVWDEGNSVGPTARLEEDGASCTDERADKMGSRILLPRDVKPELDGEEAPLQSYNVRRILGGVAEGQSEIFRESALPLESNMDYMGGIDFQKGCYVGQELTIRTRHTGVVRKRILPVQLYESARPPEQLQYDPSQQLAKPPQGTDIKGVNKKGRSTGKWLGGIGNVGLALCRLENMTDITLTGESNQWNAEHEFEMAWEQEERQDGCRVKVKAFVPEWHKNRISVRDTLRDSNISSP